MAFRIILIDLYLTYKLVLKQRYDGDLSHQSMLKETNLLSECFE